MTRATTGRRGGHFARSWINAVLGALVITLPFLADASQGATVSSVLVGIAVLILAVFNTWRAARADAPPLAWTSTLNVLLGAWLVASGFLVQSSVTFLWSNIIAGVAVALVASYNAWAATKRHEPRHVRRPMA